MKLLISVFFVCCLYVDFCYSVPTEIPHSKYGKDDEIGNVNILSSQSTKNAIKLVKKGRVLSLGLTVGSEVGVGSRGFDLTLTQLDLNYGGSAIDDYVNTALGLGTQIDGLSHFGIGGVHFNRIKAEDIYQVDGVSRLGIEKIPPIVTRAVLLDIAQLYKGGEEGVIEFGKKEIQQVEKLNSIEIRPGDVVLLNTGWINEWESKGRNYTDVKRYLGLNKEGAEYLAEKGVVAVGVDTPALDVTEEYQSHRVLMVHNGIYILEMVVTSELVKSQVNEFMFVLGQAKLRGAVQMMINPVAIF